MPLYLQLLRGQDAFHSGLTTFPQAIGVLIASQVAGRLYSRVGPRRLMTGGLFAAGVVILGFTRIGLDTSLWLIRGMMLVRGFAMGFAFVPMQAASYATIRPAGQRPRLCDLLARSARSACRSASRCSPASSCRTCRSARRRPTSTVP